MTSKTLHEAIHVVLRGAPLLPAEIAQQIELRRLWVRPSDGLPPSANQISARVRRTTYRGQFVIGSDRRIRSVRSTDAATADSDADQQRLQASIGQAVLSAAGLEHTLRLMILHEQGQRDGLDEDLASFMQGLAGKPGGVLLQRLRSLRFDAALVDRIGDAMRRRNRMIHHPAEDVALAPGLMGIDVDAAIAHVDGITADCNAIVDETLANAVEGALRVSGMTPDQFDEWFRTRDLAEIEDSRLSETLAMWRQLLDASSAHRRAG